MRAFAVVVLLIALTTPAYSQVGAAPNSEGSRTRKSDEQKKLEAEVDKAYDDALRRTKPATPVETKSDPWKDVRPVSPSGGKN